MMREPLTASELMDAAAVVVRHRAIARRLLERRAEVLGKISQAGESKLSGFVLRVYSLDGTAKWNLFYGVSRHGPERYACTLSPEFLSQFPPDAYDFGGASAPSDRAQSEGVAPHAEDMADQRRDRQKRKAARPANQPDRT